MEGEEGREVELAEVLRSVAGGVAMKCLADSGSNKSDKVRNTLVNSLAANIFDTLKANEDISAILLGVLDPARQDKETLMATLMTTVNSSLTDSLLRSTRGTSLASDCLTPDGPDSMRNSTISSSSVPSPAEEQLSPRQEDGSNRADDFVYESSCSIATKQYQMGRQVSPERVPLTVADFARSTFAVPTTVEEISSTNLMESNRPADLLLTRSCSASAVTNNTGALTICTNSSNIRPDPVLRRSNPLAMEPVITALPPLPRSLPPNIQTKMSKSSSNIFKEEEIISFMDPVEVKIKPCPSGVPASNIIPPSMEIKDTLEDEEGVVFNPTPEIIINPVEKGPDDLRPDSRTSQRSLSPLSMGPIPSPFDPVAEEAAQETFERLYEEHVTSEATNTTTTAPQTSQQNNKETKAPYTKEQNNKADKRPDLKALDTCSNLYNKHSENSVFSTSTTSTSSSQSTSHSSHQYTTETSNKESRVRIVPISLVDKHPEAANHFLDIDRVIMESIPNENKNKSCARKEGGGGDNGGQKPTQMETEVKQQGSADNTRKYCEAKQTKLKFTDIHHPEKRTVSLTPLESSLPPLEDPSVILLSPTSTRKTTSAVQEKAEETQECQFSTAFTESHEEKTEAQKTTSISSSESLNIKQLTKLQSEAMNSHSTTHKSSLSSRQEDYTDLVEEVRHIKEDKARNLVDSKLRDNISDMVAYEKHRAGDVGAEDPAKPRDHFTELREKQKAAQREFHNKLFSELQKEVSGSGEMKNSSVAEALGTKFEVKASKPLSYSKSSGQIYQSDQYQQGSSSAPSKSPDFSRRGSFSNTFMAKSPFWSSSLPRSVSRRKVTFDDETPERPPPPPPARGQSIHTMKDFSCVSETYNQVLEERKQEILNPVSQMQGQKDTEIKAETQTLLLSEKQNLKMSGLFQQREDLGLQDNTMPQTKNAVESQQATPNFSVNQTVTSGLSQIKDQKQESTGAAQNNTNSRIETESTDIIMKNESQQSPGLRIQTTDALSQPAKMAGLKNEQQREQYSSLQRKGDKNIEYKLDIGPQKDHWMELYGNSVLNNTLQERLEQHQLKKSQSAVWSSNSYSRTGQAETLEHGPVISTDKFEKPKRSSEANQHQQQQPQQSPAPFTGSLPRRGSSGVFYRSPQDFLGGGQTSLRRNYSMSDLSLSQQQQQHSEQNMPNQHQQQQHQHLHQQQQSQQHHQKQQSQQQQHHEGVQDNFQVPPSMVRSIVITVLQSQGVSDPSEEILNRAIEEYYAKNPQGVQLQPNTNTFPRTRSHSHQALNTSADFERVVHSQPYRTSSLVAPAPRTINEMGAGAPTYQHPRGPQYDRPKASTRTNQLEPRIATETMVVNTPVSAGGNCQAGSVPPSPRQYRQVNGRPIVTAPLSRSNSINQSKSFKRVMADLLPQSESDL